MKSDSVKAARTVLSRLIYKVAQRFYKGEVYSLIKFKQYLKRKFELTFREQSRQQETIGKGQS